MRSPPALALLALLPGFLSQFAAAADEPRFVSLFNGRDLSGWVNVNCDSDTWSVRDGLIACTGKPTGALRTERQYENFILELDWRHLTSGGNAGVFIWASPVAAPGVPFLRAIEVQVLDHGYGNTESHTTHGDVFPIHGSTMKPFGKHNGMRSFPSEWRSLPSPQWNHYRIECNAGVIRLSVNGKEVSGGEECMWRKGYLGLESEGAPTEWRELRIKELPSTGATPEQSAPVAEGQALAPQPLPVDMAEWFAPPAEFAGQLGDFRSPFKFYDGSAVETRADWPRRRAEIVQRWHEIMGPWPALIEKPHVEFVEWTERDGFIQHRIRVEIARGQMADGYLLVPAHAAKCPAVFVPFYDPETSIGLGKPLRDFAYQLAKRSFVTLSIGSPGGDARLPDTGAAKCQPLSYLAYVAANCANALANLKEVDANRIGTVGHSYGGKWAMFAACLNERFACAVWSDPGIVFDETRPNVNYWDPWYLGATDGPPRPVGLPSEQHPRTGAYKVLRERGMDLHELHALMAPRPFLVSGGAEDRPDRWRALNHAVAVNRFLGYAGRVAFTSRPAHDPTEESNEQIYRFFEHFLRDGAEGG